MLKKLFKLNSVKEFAKSFIIINLCAVFIYLLLAGIVRYKFRTNYDNDFVTESAKFIYSDTVCFTPYLKNSSLGYLIGLSNGTYVYILNSYAYKLIDIENFEQEEKNQTITIEYTPKVGYSYELNNGKTVDVSMLVSIKGASYTYIAKDDYISLTKTAEKEYYWAFLAPISVGYLVLIIVYAVIPFGDIKREIIQNKKRKIKRAKRDAYKKHIKDTKYAEQNLKPLKKHG